MSDSILNRVLSNDTKNQKAQTEQTNLLGEILSVQQDIFHLTRAEAKFAARDRQRDKRSGADRSPGAAVRRGSGGGKGKGDTKKTENNTFSNALKGVAGTLASVLGLKALTKALKMFTWSGFLKGAASKISGWVFGKTGFFATVFGKKGLLAKAFGKLGLGKLFGGKGLGKLFGAKGLGKMVKGGGIIAALTAGIMEYFETGKFTEALFSGGGAGAGAIAGGALGSFLGPIGTIVGSALGAFIGEQLGDILKKQLDKSPFLRKIFDFVDKQFQVFVKDIQTYIDAVKKTFSQFMYMIEQFGRAFKRFNEEAIQPFIKSVGKFVSDTWKKFTDGVSWVAKFLDKTFGPILKKIGDFLKPILDPLKKLATEILKPLVSAFKAVLDFLNPIKAATKLVQGAGNVFQKMGDFFKNYADGKQQGGFVGTVPNQGGNGDRFGAMLSPGSVVLNQTASGFMQNGGMVPTMLEQGEQVFGPNNPAAGAALAMNSMIPRFQNGGVVATDGHSNTGAGFQPGGAKDYKGRPVVLSEGAAEMFAKMMKDSKGLVKGTDVSSSKRSPSYNSEVGGVANSNHLFGDGIDVSTGSGSWNWMKSNAHNYGWSWNDYLGASGWHWDFKGKGASLPASEGPNKDGREGGIAGLIDKGVKAGVTSSMGFLQALASGIGGTASSELMQGVSSMTSGLGSEMSGLLGGGSGGGMLSGILGGGGGNNLTASSITLSGDQKQKSKQMYDYIKGKGYTSAQAKGIVANIYRESNFDPAAVGDSGTSHGLFQMHADRSAKMRGSVSNWSTNWKGQIDHALMDDVGPQYKGATSSMSAADAAYWWQTKFERPSDQAKGGPNDLKQRGFIKGMGYQNGGVANMKGNTSYSAQMASKSQQAFAEKIAEATRPIILPVPSGASGGGGGQVEQGVGTPFPNLPTEDSSIVSMEYKYRITMGASV